MRMWQGLRTVILLLAVMSLITSLAGRTFQHTSDTATAVRSDSPSAKLQHLDRDSHGWSVPVARFVTPLGRSLRAEIVPSQDPVIPADVQISLYNRPPPAC